MALLPVSTEAGTSTQNKIDPPTPRVKLPDVKRSITPSPNSWAEAEKVEKFTTKPSHEIYPTNRDRYENKPIPETAPSVSHHANLQQRRHIQPAIPLINTSSVSKHRAVTDPIQHRALLSTKKPSISQLKKRGKIFEFSTSKIDLPGESSSSNSTVPPKALQLLGVKQDEAFGQQMSAVRVKLPAQIDEIDDGPPSEDPSSTRLSPEQRQPNVSVEVADVAIGEENSLQHPPVLSVKDSNVAKSYPVPQESSSSHLQLPIDAGSSNQNQQANNFQQQGLHPSKSFQAIIEIASTTSTEENDASKSGQQTTPTKGLQREPSGELLRPTVYSPNSYNGVWEFDPAVGHTLPPFSPMPKLGHPDHRHVPESLKAGSSDVFQKAYLGGFPRNPSAIYIDQHQDPTDGSTHPATQLTSLSQAREALQPNPSRQALKDPRKRDMQPNASRAIPSRDAPKGHGVGSQPQQEFQHGQHGLHRAVLDSRTQSVFNPPPTPSNNSWATGTPSGTPVPPPQWPVLQLHNPVPSPPFSQQDYLRPSPLSAGLAQLDLTLHHHIDSIFNSLSRQITDKHDRVLDRVLIRIDNLEEKVCKDVRGLKSEMHFVKKEMEKMRNSAAQKPEISDVVINALQAFGSRLSSLEEHVDQIKCKGHIQFADTSSGESTGNRQRFQFSQHQVGYAHGSFDEPTSTGDRQHRMQHRNGVGNVPSSRSPSKSRHSGNSNSSEKRGTRSRAASVSGWRADEPRIEAERAVRVDKLSGPDLRDHPAFKPQKEAGQTNTMAMLEGETLSKQALGEEGWYQQAYGRRS